MSRVGKKPIELGDKVTAEIKSGSVMVTGPHGSISRVFKPEIKITVEDGKIKLEPEVENLDTLALWGTYASHIANMVEGVAKPFVEKLVIEGIGYKADVKGDKLVLALGFSHPVNVPISNDLKVVVEKNVITVSGVDKEKVGQFAAYVRSLKKPEPYKGKGIMYEGEKIRRKQGKKTA